MRRLECKMNLVIIIGIVLSLVENGNPFTDAINPEECLSMLFDSGDFQKSMALYRQCVAVADQLTSNERLSYLTRIRSRFDTTWSDLAGKVGIAPYRLRFLPEVRKRSARDIPSVFSYDDFPPPMIAELASSVSQPKASTFNAQAVLMPIDDLEYPEVNATPVIEVTELVYSANFLIGMFLLFSLIFCLSMCFIVKSWCLADCLIIDCCSLCGRS